MRTAGGAVSRVLLVVRMMRMLVMRVVMLALGCRHFYWLIEFADDETKQIGQLCRVPPTGPIAYLFDCHQRERPKTTAQGRDNRGTRGRRHFLTNNASIGRIAFQQFQRRRGWYW